MKELTTDSELLQILNGKTQEPAVTDKPIIDFSFANYLGKAKMKNDMKMIFGNYFQTNELCLLAAKTGIGKSILGYTIADGISKGIDILNQPNECEPMKVLLYDFELEMQNTKKRFWSYEPNENFLRPNMNDILLSTDGRFDFGIVEQHILATGAKVVIIDNISAIAVKSLQDQDQALQLIKDAKLLKSKYDISIILIAHTPKIKENKPLELYDIAGSANIHNFIDSAIMIGKSTQDVNYRYIKSVKNRNSSESDEVLVCEINNDGWLHFDFVGMQKESDQLVIDENRQQKLKSKLIDVAHTIIGTKQIRYADFCNDYANHYGKSYESGKKLINQMLNANIIVKDNDGKYIMNGNEVSF